MGKYLLIVLVIVIFLAGCTNEAIHDIRPDNGIVNPLFNVTGQYDVYIAGARFGDNELPTEWRNGVVTGFPDSGAVRSIFVVGGDVYAAGWVLDHKRSIATYWKNRVSVHLSDTTDNVIAESIFVSGGDVYITGTALGNFKVEGALAGYTTHSSAILWKNGARQSLSSPGYQYSVAKSVFVSGSDVYVAGGVLDPGNPLNLRATYWKNGSAFVLVDGAVPSSAQSVFVSGNDIYVAGTVHDSEAILFTLGEVYEFTTRPGEATYWKNGKAVTLGTNCHAQSVFVLGNDIYIAGFALGADTTLSTPFGGFRNEIAMYWKNGKSVALDSSSYNSRATSIFISADGAVHTCGYINSKATYWKNTTATYIDPVSDYNGSFGFSIFLAQH